MKALISQKNITEYNFTDEVSIAYIKALIELNGGEPVDEQSLSLLKKAKLYKNDKLRVFNYKKPNPNKYTISDEVKKVFRVWQIQEPAAKQWYRNKTFVEACQEMIDIHGLEKVLNVVHILVPIGNKEEYIKTIRNPQQLLSVYGNGSLYVDRFRKQGLFDKYKKEMIIRQKQIKDYGTT